MSELKDYKVYTTMNEGAWGYHYEPNPNKDQSDIELNGKQVYLKKDADKVIARHKYKRCLAMARMCEAEAYKCLTQQSALICFPKTDRFHYLQGQFIHFSRWHRHWLKLAEEPTWAKFLRLIHKEAK